MSWRHDPPMTDHAHNKHAHTVTKPAATPPRSAEPFGDDTRRALRQIIDARRDVRRRFLPDPGARRCARPGAPGGPPGPVGRSDPALGLPHPHRSRPCGPGWPTTSRRSGAGSPPPCPRPAPGPSTTSRWRPIRESPLNLVVTSTLERGGAHVLGRFTQPEMAHYSTCLAVREPVAHGPGRGAGRRLGQLLPPRRALGRSSGCRATSCRSPTCAWATSRSSTPPPSWRCGDGPRRAR